MKNKPGLTLVMRTLSVVVSFVLLPTLGHAEGNQYFDANGTTWDAGVTQDWDNGADVWVAGNDANFNSNTVTVDGTVSVAQMIFTGGPTTISGGTIDLGNSPSAYSNFNDYNNADFSASNANPVVITSQIVLGASGGDTQTFVNNNTGFSDVAGSGSSITLGNVDFSINTADARLQLNAHDNGASITLDGTYTTSGSGGGAINFGADTGTGVYTLAPTADFTQYNTSFGAGNAYQEQNSFSFTGDVLNIETSKFNGNQTMAYYSTVAQNQVNIVGKQNIALNIYSSQKNDQEPGDGDGVSDLGEMKFAQTTMDESTWSGAYGDNQNGASTTLSAVAGGRLDWDIALNSSAPLGLTVTGNGTVVLGATGGNPYNESDGNGFLASTSTTAADLQSGTTLITNTSGSAFGSPTTTAQDPNFPGNTNHFVTNTEVVKLEGGATLGGTGYSQVKIVAESATSVIAPGDAGQSNLGILPSIGTLHLFGVDGANGGLEADHGMIFDFKLTAGNIQTGVSNDAIDFAGSNLTLNGPITINLSQLGSGMLATGPGNAYTLMFASIEGENWSGMPTFDVIAPEGYALDTSYNGTGYDFDTNLAGDNFSAGDTFTVQLVATPEPSTYGLMGLGLLALVAIGRFRRLNA